VQRKIAIGRHERVLAIDGDYIHVGSRDAATAGTQADGRRSCRPNRGRFLIV
jgi:hypothetical protein